MIKVANELPREKYQPFILFINNQGPLIQTISSHVGTLSLDKKRISHSFFSFLKAIMYLQPDIILSSISHLNIAVLFLKPFLSKNSRIFVRESNIASISLKGEKRYSLFVLLIKILYPKAQKVICLGHAMKRDLCVNFRVPEKQIVTIYNPVDTDALRSAALFSGNPFPAHEKNLLAVGSLTHQKGFDLLIKAMALSLKHLPGLHLTILGDGPLEDDLRLLISQKRLDDAITLTGFKANPYPYFYHADKFILSSRYEGLPNVVLEAIALGTEVIAFDSPGCIKDIITDPSQGILVTPCTSEALAQAIVKSCQNHNNRISPTLPEKFKMKIIVRQYQEIFSA